MPEFRKPIFKPREDLWPLIGYESFKKRNGNASYNGWDSTALMVYHALWFTAIAGGTLVAISYAISR